MASDPVSALCLGVMVLIQILYVTGAVSFGRTVTSMLLALGVIGVRRGV